MEKEMKILRRLLIILVFYIIAVIAWTVLEIFVYPQLKTFNNGAIGSLNLVAVSVSIYGIKCARSLSNVRLRKKAIALNTGCLLLNLGLAVMNFSGFI